MFHSNFNYGKRKALQTETSLNASITSKIAIKLYFKLSISRRNVKLQPVILFDRSIGREISFRSSLNRVKMFIESSDEYSFLPIFRL